MGMSDKVKTLLATKGMKSPDYAAYIGITPQAMRNKLTRGFFSADDLIHLAKFLNMKLLFQAEDGSTIVLDEGALQKKKNPDN